MNAQEITKALGGRWHGAYGMARCPAHDDRDPSLSVRDGVDGEPVFHCFAGCDWRNIKDVLRAKGILPERGSTPCPHNRRYRPPDSPTGHVRCVRLPKPEPSPAGVQAVHVVCPCGACGRPQNDHMLG